MCVVSSKTILQHMQKLQFNPNALRKAKIVHNFGLSECNGVNLGAHAVWTGSFPFIHLHRF